MNLGELEFKPEDFKDSSIEIGGENYIKVDYAVSDANSLLRERLEKDTKVWGSEDYDTRQKIYFDHEDTPSDPTLRAVVVCEEKIGK